jgi:16S rRNA processing protein RimM
LANADWVVVGRIIKAHALAGQVVVFPETDAPERFRPGSCFFTRDRASLTVRSSHRFEKGFLVGFEEVGDRTAAEALRGAELLIRDTDRRQLGLDEYWPDDLVGLEVRDMAGLRVGVITGVDDTTAQHRLVIQGPREMVEVPLVEALVPEVNVSGRVVVIRPIPGLLDAGHINDREP